MFSEVTPFLKGKIEAEAGIGCNPYEPGCDAYLDYEAGRRSGEFANAGRNAIGGEASREPLFNPNARER